MEDHRLHLVLLGMLLQIQLFALRTVITVLEVELGLPPRRGEPIFAGCLR